MTLTFGLSPRANSSTTPSICPRRSGDLKHRSEGFSAFMRPEQEASRSGVGLPVGGQARGVATLASVTLGVDGNLSGPRGDPPLPPIERDEFQRYGHEEGPFSALAPWVDPLQRVLAHSTPPPESVAPHVANPSLAMDELWRTVRRIAWGGDRHRGVAHIELGAGELSGAAVTLEARGTTISLVLELPSGASGAGWAERLADRLARRGLEVESVEVR